jgi:hypothetical protein
MIAYQNAKNELTAKLVEGRDTLILPSELAGLITTLTDAIRSELLNVVVIVRPTFCVGETPEAAVPDIRPYQDDDEWMQRSTSTISYFRDGQWFAR